MARPNPANPNIPADPKADVKPDEPVNPANPADAQKNPDEQNEPAKVKILLAEAVNSLPDLKISEIHSLVVLKMEECGHLPIQNCMSSIAATMMSISGTVLNGVSDNIEKLQKSYSPILGIWKDPARSPKERICAIAAVFDSLAA